MRKLTLGFLLVVGWTLGATGPKDWTVVDGLIKEQKLQEALTVVEQLQKDAGSGSDDDSLAKALIMGVQLKTALGRTETAVRELRAETWPKAPLPRLAVELFYAQSLMNYLGMYGWEVRQRERLDTKGSIDLKAWTADQIHEEALKVFAEAWKGRSELSKVPIGAFHEYLERNNYPDGIRSTVRDALSYLAVALLSDSSHWSAAESNELYRLDFQALLKGGSDGKVDLAAESVHPLRRALGVLDDLEAWHDGEDHEEAALEARLQRVRTLHDAYSDDDKRQALITYLRKYLPGKKSLSWWSTGMALLSSYEEEQGQRVAALATAKAGMEPNPGSLGALICKAAVDRLTAPSFNVVSMQTDAAGKRSLEVSHQNLKALHFRAYPVDLVKHIETSQDYSLLPDYQQWVKLKKTKPAAAWTVDLPETPDLKTHRTYVVPKVDKPGLYYIAASANADFAAHDLSILGVAFVISDYVIVSRTEQGRLFADIVKGDEGEVVPGAKLKLYRFDYGKKHKVKDEKTTNKQGTAEFVGASGDYASHFLVGEKDGQVFVDPEHQYFQQEPKEKTRRSSFIYTDRSIYRPNQKIQWKVVTYQGKAGTGEFQALPSQTVEMTLLDANYQEVAKQKVKTNDFGSAAGSFDVPAGRLLGSWQIRSSVGGNSSSVKVEEYKRPTYEVGFEDPKEPLRLNRQAKLVGTARYYFGLPVTSGKIQWRVTKEPVYPWWWSYYYDMGAATTKTETIATGSATLDEQGKFEIKFLPAAEEKGTKASKSITYNYVATADLTDEGGETRSAMRSFRLGFISIEAAVRTTKAFESAGEKITLAAHRHSLDGLPRAGEGSFRVFELKQPAAALPPSEIPLPRLGDEGKNKDDVETPGDKLRPRHSPEYSFEQELARWEDGEERTKGTFKHDGVNEATTEIAGLPAGAYRIRYETKDEFGATAETWKEFVVVASGAPKLNVPAALIVQESTVAVGGKARIFWHSGLPGQNVILDVTRSGIVEERRHLKSGVDQSIIEIPIEEKDRGGFGLSLTVVSDFQLLRLTQMVQVGWDNKQLGVEFETFRDKLKPGAKEKWRVKIKGKDIGKASAEVLAYMYDKSLDFFTYHSVPSTASLLPNRTGQGWLKSSLGAVQAHPAEGAVYAPGAEPPELIPDELKFFDEYGILGMGRRRFYGSTFKSKKSIRLEMPAPSAPSKDGAEEGVMAEASAMDDMESAPSAPAQAKEIDASEVRTAVKGNAGGPGSPAVDAPVQVRSNFSETAFFKPQLLTDKDGAVTIEFEAPESVTAWNFWVVAMTKDLRGTGLRKDVQTVKNLMVRPYLPRFLREGDQAELKVVVNNASEAKLQGELTLELTDPETQKDVSESYGLSDKKREFDVAANGSTNVTFALKVPPKVGLVAFRVVAKAKDESDGELRPLPVLPSRMHLTQSRFVTLKDKETRTLEFPDMAKGGDDSLVNEQLVVSVDAQLFYTVLKALPYLVQYPYECSEQTLNRFLSTGIAASVYASYPAVAKMAKELSQRKTQLESFDAVDPNRKMAFEESPWLQQSRGKAGEEDPALINVLDPRVAKAERDAALTKLRKSQTSSGGFSWFPGGPPSPYITLYLMHGFARALEFGIDVPKDLVERGWQYLARHFREDYVGRLMGQNVGWEFLTFLNFVASSYPDPSWMGEALSDTERDQILAFSFKHWKEHSPFLKAYLALTLKRSDRLRDAQLVFDSVMDSAKTEKDQGTFWAQEDRSWLWYNDTIETHAFALRTLTELDPANAKKDGLVLWLFLNKKLNHWKSTRATAEVIYSLVHYLKKESALGVKEEIKVQVGPKQETFKFAPDKFTGRAQLVVHGPEVDPKTMSTVTVAKETKGVAFASATWSFATDELPKEARGDFFQVERRYFKRSGKGQEFTLKPLADGDQVAVGDEVEVQLSLSAKHEAEYVHLRDPRAAGFEPTSATSGYRYDLGIYWYEEVRDSGANFFFERLPVGQYQFKYRIRASMAGTFRVGPAEVQSMYAPEFSAYSAGNLMKVAASH